MITSRQIQQISDALLANRVHDAYTILLNASNLHSGQFEQLVERYKPHIQVGMGGTRQMSFQSIEMIAIDTNTLRVEAGLEWPLGTSALQAKIPERILHKPRPQIAEDTSPSQIAGRVTDQTSLPALIVIVEEMYSKTQLPSLLQAAGKLYALKLRRPFMDEAMFDEAYKKLRTSTLSTLLQAVATMMKILSETTFPREWLSKPATQENWDAFLASCKFFVFSAEQEELIAHHVTQIKSTKVGTDVHQIALTKAFKQLREHVK